MTDNLLPLHIPAPKDELLYGVARGIADQIAARTEISRRSLAADMGSAFGATDASGAWLMRDAYDALEAAQVIGLMNPAGGMSSERSPTDILAHLLALTGELPTQTYRSEGQVALQQFSTPMPLAYLAGCAAKLTRFDTVLEPSAGTGMIAAAAIRAGCRLHLNELDPLRAGLLSRLFPGTAVTGVDGAAIADHLAVRPLVVLMNPPYSKSAGIGDDAFAGARHLRSALLALADGGRLVAIMPSWFSPNGSGSAGYAAVAKLVAPTADILCKGGVYAKHGTGIDVRLVVYDKGRTVVTPGAASAATIEADDLQHLLKLIGDLPPRLVIAPAAASTPSLFPPRVTATKPASNGNGLMSRASTPRPIAPRPPMLDLAGSDAREIAFTPRSEPRAAADPVGIYVPYRVARIDFSEAREHPTPLVESMAMASILPPPPTYRPQLPGVATKALSEAQLETLT